MLIGRATRAQRFLMALPKRYETVARLGFTSTTGDVDGEIEPGRMPAEPLALPTGRLRQRPPAYSAVRVGGKRAYALARAGEAVEIPEREVEVTRFEQLWRDGERAAFAIECGSGTYVRSLIADLGDAYCLELRRTAIGPFGVADAGRFVGLAEALDFLPGVELAGDDARRAGHGVAISAPGGPSRGHGAAARRRRADRARGAPGGRHAQARRRLPRLMQVTWLPDVEPRPRHVAVGEFDGVHLGHREVIARRRHRADVRAAPAHGRVARDGAEADHVAGRRRPT